MPVCGLVVGRDQLDAGAQAGEGQVCSVAVTWMPPASVVESCEQVDGDALGLGDQAADGLGELGGLEGQAVDVVVADGVDEVLAAQQQGELAEVHLGHEHLVVALEDLAEVLRERVEVAQVDLGDVVAGLADPAAAGADRAVRRAPADHQDLAPRRDGSSTSSGGSESAIRSTLAWRVRTMRSWLAGS